MDLKIDMLRLKPLKGNYVNVPFAVAKLSVMLKNTIGDEIDTLETLEIQLQCSLSILGKVVEFMTQYAISPMSPISKVRLRHTKSPNIHPPFHPCSQRYIFH